MTLEQKLEQYLEAKEAYYNDGQITLSDYEFDILENELLQHGLISEKLVGAEDEGANILHRTPMLSLAKVQVFGDSFEQYHFDECVKLLKRQGIPLENIKIQSGFKLDGAAVNVLYTAGKLQQILTRGNGTKGRDITEKFKYHVPQTLIHPKYGGFTGEIRGEAIMTQDSFNALSKDTKYKNPRNLTSGILRDENLNDSRKGHIQFALFDVRGHFVKNLTSSGNDINQPQGRITNATISDFSLIDGNTMFDWFKHFLHPAVMDFSLINMTLLYDSYKELRNKIDFGVDGFVIKITGINYNDIKNNGHDPFHSLAIKFPPKKIFTTLLDVKFNLNKTGKYTPIAIFEPVDVDGSTVSKACMGSVDLVEKLQAWPGSIVEIAKNGDIIPQIQTVVERPENYTLEDFRKTFPTGATFDGKHLFADKNLAANEIKRMKFINQMLLLGLDNFSGATYSKLYDLGNRDGNYSFTSIGFLSAFNNPLIENHINLAKKNIKEILGEGKSFQNFTERIKTRKKDGLHIHTIILMLQIDRLGNKIAEQLGKKISGVEYSLKSLDKAVIEEFEKEENQEQLNSWIRILTNSNIPIHYYKEEAKDERPTFEMTLSGGMPLGFKTKEEFVQTIPAWRHTSLNKKTDYLITDDLDSNTGKMKTARKYGTKIITYEQAIELAK